jgi:all-trans-retinol 13,14-reductase
LVCGAILSMEGYQITVLEMNKQLGGTAQIFARDKHIFDAGVHYVGGLDKGQNLYKIFTYLGIMDKLKIEKMSEDAFDKLYFDVDGKEYSYAQGYDKFIATLVADFPDEREAIEKYCSTIRSICENFPLYNIRIGDGYEKMDFLETDTKQFIASLTSNERLRDVLAGNNALYAGIADKTPLYVHALVLNSYIESSYRFINGGTQITRLLAKIITDRGGVIKNKTEI